MRAVSAALLFLVAASLASAQSCTAPSSDTFATASVAGCALLQTCQKNLCACTGGSGAFPGCLAANMGTCAATQTCYSSYFKCLIGITAARTNTSDVACSTYGNTLYIAQLAAATSPSLNGTALSGSCGYNVCLLANATGNTANCGGSAVSNAVCNAATLLGNTAPVTTSISTTARATDIVVTLRISGGNWSAILADPVKKAQAITALTQDLAKLLGVDPSFIVIFSLELGSLVVTFGVYQGSGKSPSQLQTTVVAAQGSSSWLTSTQSVYSTVSSETLTTLSVQVTATAAPTTLAPGQTNPGTKSSAVSAAGVWAVATVAAIAALLA